AEPGTLRALRSMHDGMVRRSAVRPEEGCLRPSSLAVEEVHRLVGQVDSRPASEVLLGRPERAEARSPAGSYQAQIETTQTRPLAGADDRAQLSHVSHHEARDQGDLALETAGIHLEGDLDVGEIGAQQAD